MASTTKSFNPSDVVSTQTDLYESIPITGSLLYGTYSEPPATDSNVKTYSHGMYQTVYDYPHASSSANQLFDLAVGLSSDSSLYGAATASANSTVKENAALKLNMYNQMAQILSGYDKENELQRFDQDGDLNPTSAKHDDVFFLAFSRVLTKDAMQKGQFNLQVGTGSATSDEERFAGDLKTISDTGAQSDYFVNSPAGEYGILKEGSNKVGLIYYDAGIAVVSKDIFSGITNFDGTDDADHVLTSGSVDDFANEVRKRIYNIKFNNVTELNSTIYHCRVHSGDFNYSTNPTYLSQSQIVVKNNATDDPVSYITGVGLYSENGELLAVAKLSEPVKNTPDTDFTIKVRLDY